MSSNYKCVTDIKGLGEYMSSGADICAFDIETAPDEPYRGEERAALDPHKSHIVGISLSNAPGSGIYLPLAHKTGENFHNTEALWEMLAMLFQSPRFIKIAHHLSFESMFFYAKGIVIQPPCYDTIAAAQLSLKNATEFRGLSDSGLKTLVPELLGIELPSFNSVTGGKHFDELDPQDSETIRYACADSDYALRLRELFNNWFDRFLPKHRYVVEEIESPTSVYTGIMKYCGLPIDEKLMLAKKTEAEEKLAKLREEIAFIIGDVNIGANASTSAFKNYLFKDLKLPVLKTTAKRQEAADDETLILLAEWCAKNRPELAPLFKLVQEYRKWGKLLSTYIDGYMPHINAATGRIHPDLMPLATETGRFASRNPNCQNMPRPGNDEIGVRNFICASDGKVLLALDFSQIELRVGAFYCRDEKMLETYRNGGDIHAQTTSVIYKIPFEQAVDKHAENYKERRTISKNCNFGVFFGLFAKGLQQNLKFKAGLDTPLDECEKIIKNLKAGYPRLERWQKETAERAAKCGYTETWLGRRRYLPGIRSSNWGVKSFAERCALNSPIQGTAIDLLKLAIGRLLPQLRANPWLCPILQVHDELVFEIPENRVDDAIAIIKPCMEALPFPEFDMPVVAESSCGKRYGDLEEL